MNAEAKGLAVLIWAIAAPAQASFPSGVVDLATTSAPTTLIGASQGNVSGLAFAVGDFNGDGQRDLAVLAAGTTGGNTNPPFVTILFTCATLSGSIDLAAYAGVQSTIRAVNGDAGTRATLASGNFNGDNVDDLALGVTNNTQATNYDGKVYLVFGGPSLAGATVLLENPSVPTALLLPPSGSSGWLGSALAVGDVNNDGLDEILVSAPYHPPGGRVYVVRGQAPFPQLVNLDTSTKVTRIIDAAHNACGIGLDSGDANSDGYSDILIGSPGDGVISRGIVSLIRGQKALPSTILLTESTPGVTRFYGEYEHGALGWRVCLADMNGDGLRDPIMAAPVADPFGCEDCGQVYAVYWNESLADSIPLATTPVPMTRFVGSGYVELYGENMAAGYLNADLCADLVLKREADDFVPMDRRSVVIAYGQANLPGTVFLDNDPTLFRILAEQPADYLGLGLGVADLDDDGISDVCIGAPYANASGRLLAGKTHIFYGCPTTTAVQRTPAGAAAIRAYPNPFASTTTLELLDPTGQGGQLSIFNVKGQRVFETRTPPSSSGMTELAWRGDDGANRQLPSGIYFCKFTVDGHNATIKLVLLR